MLLGARQGRLPATCFRRAGEGAEAPPSKTVSNHRYLSIFKYFSFTSFNPFLGAKSNLPSLALISAPDAAVSGALAGKEEQRQGEMLVPRWGAGATWAFSWACALQPCTAFLRTLLSASIKSFYS